ncbi:iron ABC transporter permease [Fontimonas sp. SYSU GA230001]|uniref:FecCD family ABC transporter permease n=1 Tax=Fontimonas sp. SYSU GA230001 TaxID=3142450 RepID=UPI0032B34E23
MPPDPTARRHTRWPYAALVLLLATAIAAALLSGPVTISLPKLASLAGWPADPPLDGFERIALLQIRLPRVLLALLLGAALAVAGAGMQGIVRNPLADPGLLGVSAGAALAAAAFIVLGLGPGLPPALTLPAVSFAGGAVAAWAVLRLSLVDGRTRVATLLLTGLALNAVATAGIALLSYVADDYALRAVTLWMFGSLSRAGLAELSIGAPLLLLALVAIALHARSLNALLLGEAEAQHLGVDVESLKRRMIALVVLAVATSVALAGSIAFVGLIVPHLVRLWTGPDHRRLLPACMLLGALLLLLADTAARTLFAPAELPIGVLTALIGGPLFIGLLLRHGDRAEMA